ncbi:hypothetical protein DOM22_16955 [Bdellovibrio sp. ZAP7]|uniref:hypothetical protein n=1 Tax=Bdellovibrio sp. ZAP7 TaxID=2231053 RepID=UPI0011586DA3|nr:hypothetical protein [Bdellovibrio sp. ZAP7]QDK46722.1 hypothetical protein DOM22_16955 [Bdellovibrio sp. ZAP7]
MKNIILPLVALTLTMSACSYKSPTEDLDKAIAKSQRDLDAIIYGGGQPGKINVNGVIVTDESGSLLLDKKISILQEGGLGSRNVGTAVVGEKNKPTLSPTVKEESPQLASAHAQLISEGYVNLGCENLTAEDVQGLEERKLDSTETVYVFLAAKKVFICGEQHKNGVSLNIMAEELVLKDVRLTVVGIVGGIAVKTQKLELQGKNLLGTAAPTSNGIGMDAPGIALVVEKELSGPGDLMLISTGGAVVEKK